MPATTQMTPDMMDQTSNLMGGIDVDMLPIDTDMALADPESQNYLLTSQSQQARAQQNSLSTAEVNDGFAVPNNMSGAGAGPLPTGFGMQSSASTGSTLTEFTKRRNWSQRVIEEIRDFLHILTPDGRIIYASPSCKMLTGYEQSQIVGYVITDFIHPDDSSLYIREFHESIASGNPLRFFYRFRKEDGSYVIFEAHGHPHLSSEAASFGSSSAASFCRGVFMMSRPYPTKNTTLLDSFLEHKIENERLTKKIADLRREEQEEIEAQERHLIKKAEGHSSVTPSETQRTDNFEDSQITPVGQPVAYDGMPPPAKPAGTSSALTRQNLDVVQAESRPDSIKDKMARYEGASPFETIEMLTGLRYQDGERSHGISTGDHSPALIRGDAGIAILADKDRNANAEKFMKKKKVADEYVCTDCGTLDSPEWRKGPNGPKTLCNACGCTYLSSFCVTCYKQRLILKQ